MLFTMPLKNKASFNADRCSTFTLPKLDPEGVVHKTARNRFPLQGHDPMITMLYKLILFIYRGHPGIGPS